MEAPTPTRVPPWFALQVRPRFEKVTAELLEQKGYETFLPLYQSRRRWSDRIKTVELPLFPAYLFSRFEAEARLPILTTPGVIGVLGSGKHPVPVDEIDIANVRAVVASGLPACPWPFLECGDAIQITQGPLRGLEGILVRSDRHERLVVSVRLLQRSVAVDIHRDWVRPVRLPVKEVFRRMGREGRARAAVALVTRDAKVVEAAARVAEAQRLLLVHMRDAGHALDTLRRPDAEIDVLLTDIATGEASGIELASALKARWPELKVIYLSSPEDAIRLALPARSGSEVLSKPPAPEALGAAIGRLLAGSIPKMAGA
jgi:transcription antitermination factor NusG